MRIAMGGVWRTSLKAGSAQEASRIIPGAFSDTANTNILPWRRTPFGDILATSWRHSDAETSPDAPGRVLETFLRSRHRNHSPENGIDRERSGAEWTRHSLKRRHQGNSSRQSAGADFRRLLPGIRLSKRTPYAPLTSNEVADTPAWTWRQRLQAVSVKSQIQAFLGMVQAMCFRVILFSETKDNVVLQLLKSSLSNEVADTPAWTWQSDLEPLARFACVRQKDQNQDLSLDFWYREMPDFLTKFVLSSFDLSKALSLDFDSLALSPGIIPSLKCL